MPQAYCAPPPPPSLAAAAAAAPSSPDARLPPGLFLSVFSLRRHISHRRDLFCNEGPSVTQCLGLSLLSSVVATLGAGLVGVGGADAGSLTLVGVASSSSSSFSSDEKHMKELQGSQVRKRKFVGGGGVSGKENECEG